MKIRKYGSLKAKQVSKTAFKKVLVVLFSLLVLCGCSTYSKFYKEAIKSEYLESDDNGYYSSKFVVEARNNKYYFVKMDKDAITVYPCEPKEDGVGFNLAEKAYFWASVNGDDTMSLIDPEEHTIIECYTIGLSDPYDFKDIYSEIRNACSSYVNDISDYLD